MDLNYSLEPVIERLMEGPGIALTGAGMSTASGIPDFRSEDGLWARFPPAEFAHVQAFKRDPVKVWQMLSELEDMVTGALPNEGHRALADLEHAGVITGLITQNVDGLHQASGSREVVEFHGSGRRLRCLSCRKVLEGEDMAELERPPRCPRCAAIMKPDVVLFGEVIPDAAMERSLAMMRGSSALLVCGTSAEVYPASQIPEMARARGLEVFEFNREPCLSERLVRGRVLGCVTQSLPALAASMLHRSG